MSPPSMKLADVGRATLSKTGLHERGLRPQNRKKILLLGDLCFVFHLLKFSRNFIYIKIFMNNAEVKRKEICK